MAIEDIQAARMSLLLREGIPERHLESRIGVVNHNDETTDLIKVLIQEWLKSLKLDAAIWTNLTPKFAGEDNRIPTREEAILHLRNLETNARVVAEEYIRRTPKQIDTVLRREFERDLGWTHIE
jgi:hypothetical protein